MSAVKVRLATEFDCPDCGKLDFASYVKINFFQLKVPEVVTCRHCKSENNTADHPSFETSTNTDEFVWLRVAWEFDCPACKKLSYSSFVSYKPPLESEQDAVKIEVMEFASPNEVICQHCGVESPTDKKNH